MSIKKADITNQQDADTPTEVEDFTALDIDPDLRATKGTPLITFNSHRLRIRLTLSGKHCSASEAPPEHLIKKARTKMEKLKEAGAIANYVVHESLLDEVWTKLRQNGREVSSVPEQVIIDLAVGIPVLPGLEIVVHPNQNPLATVSIHASADKVSQWRFEWVMGHIDHELRAQGVNSKPNSTQIHGALRKAQAGMSVQNIEIMEEEPLTRKNSEAYHLGVDRLRQEVSLVVFDLKALSELQTLEQRLIDLEKASEKAASGKKYLILRKELLSAIKNSLEGPEKLGIGMPFSLLAAINISALVKEKDASTCFRFSVADDRMSAGVSVKIDENMLARKLMSKKWLYAELAKAGITHGLKVNLFDDLTQLLKKSKPIEGYIVARGAPERASQDPYIHICGIDDVQSESSTQRVYRRQVLVKAGALVAEMRFKVPPVVGIDVTGRSIAPAVADDLPSLAIGEGVERRSDGKFYALFAGAIDYEDGTLSVRPALVHEGDANSISGDIIFDGLVEIKGNIESGAKVVAGGDLIVHGEISGGFVESAGNITVARGIVASGNGSVRAKGDIEADFIENSQIVCRGSLKVRRSILQSDIMVGGSISITNTTNGVVGGGAIACGGSIHTASLGLPNGAATEVNAGVSFSAEATVRLRRKRLENIEKRADLDRRKFKELSQMHPSKISKAKKQERDLLRQRVKRWAQILTSAHMHLEKSVGRLTYNFEARVFVSGSLSNNCKITLAGKSIPNTNGGAGVVVSPEAKDGLFIRPMTKVGK